MLLLARLPAAASDWVAGPVVSLSPRIGAMISLGTAWRRITGRHRVCDKPVSIKKLMRPSMASKVGTSIPGEPVAVVFRRFARFAVIRLDSAMS